jgi:hypothetical protein
LSLRSVRSGICALLLAGATTLCVVIDVSALDLPGSLRDVARASSGRRARVAVRTLFH